MQLFVLTFFSLVLDKLSNDIFSGMFTNGRYKKTVFAVEQGLRPIKRCTVFTEADTGAAQGGNKLKKQL